MLPSNCVAVTVVSAKNLTSHSQSGKPDVFATVQLNGQKFQTSVQLKTSLPVWQERFTLEMKSKYSILIVSVYRRTYLAFSEFLGQLRLPMDEFCDTELGAKPRARWYPLKGKSGVCDEHRYRGELEIMLEFFNKPAEPSTKTTKATTHSNPFLNVDLRRSALHNLGKGLHFKSLARKEADIIQSQLPTAESLAALPLHAQQSAEEFGTNSLFRKSASGQREKQCPKSDENQLNTEDRTSADFGKSTTSNRDSEPVPAEPFNAKSNNLDRHCYRFGVDWHCNLSREELIEIVEEQKVLLSRQHNRVRELEEYIDRLVFKVMASHPELLQIPDNNFRSGVR